VARGKGHRRGGRGRGKGKGGDPIECHRRGRPGHIKPKCYAKKHKDGHELTDAPPATPPKKKVNEVEVESTPPLPSGMHEFITQMGEMMKDLKSIAKADEGTALEGMFEDAAEGSSEP